MSGHVHVCLLSSLILSIPPSLVSKIVPSFTHAHTHRVWVGQAAWWHSTTVIICDPDHFSLQRECGKTSNYGGKKCCKWLWEASERQTHLSWWHLPKKAEETLWHLNSAWRYYPNKCVHYLPAVSCSFKGTVQPEINPIQTLTVSSSAEMSVSLVSYCPWVNLRLLLWCNFNSK